MALGIRFNQNAGQPTLQPRVPLKAIGCWTAFDRWTSISRGPGSSSPHPQKKSRSPSPNQSDSHAMSTGSKPPCPPSTVPAPTRSSATRSFRGARREHSGVNAVSRESRPFGPVSLLGLSLGQGRSGGWRVGRLAGRAVGGSRPVMTGAYCPGLIAWTAVLRAVNAVHPIDYTSSNGFVRTTQGRIVVLR